MLVTPLVNIFNRSLSSGIFPSSWKSSYIIPIFKSGDRCNVGNYRGVCIQSAIPKIFDKMLSVRLSSACKHFISDQQHGFTAKRSTVTNLLCYQHDILESFQSGSSVHSIYTDVSKAFDRVDTRFLISKLRSYGIDESFLFWLTSYFTGRSQSVLVGGSLSSPIQVLSGVGQGSHSGPLLFSLFFNDLPQFIHHSSVLMFADDVKLYKSIRSLSDCHLLQRDLNAFQVWLIANGMSLSLHKCFVIEFSRSKSFNFSYSIESIELSRVDKIKDLGVIFDQKLSFVPCISNVSLRCHRVLGYVLRNSKGLSFDAFCLLYKSLVRSLLEYASIVWSPFYEVHIDTLERVQRKFISYCRYRFPNIDIEISSLGDRRRKADSSFFHKLIEGDVDCPKLLSLVSLDCHRRLRRNHTYFVKQCCTNYNFFEPMNRIMRNENAVVM